jgi:signal peptidase I
VLQPFVAALLILGIVAGAARMLRRRIYRVEVAGDSMRPALAPGDFLVLRRGAPAAGRVRAGAIVALHDATGRLILKRVIGLPGESLRVGTAVQVNRRRLVEPYAMGETPQAQFRGVNQLGADEYFLIGDNRGASTDSRDFGAVARTRIEGVAVFRYWPLSRLGRIVPPPREVEAEIAEPELPLGMIRPRSGGGEAAP